MSKHGHSGSSVPFYIFIALVLGAITYVEYAIVEYDFAFLTTGSALFGLFSLSIIKFLLVVLFFMHLKQDSNLLSGLFSSGIFIAGGTIAALLLVFSVHHATTFMRARERAEMRLDERLVEPKDRALDGLVEDFLEREQPGQAEASSADASRAPEPGAATGPEGNGEGAPVAGASPDDPAEASGSAQAEAAAMAELPTQARDFARDEDDIFTDHRQFFYHLYRPRPKDLRVQLSSRLPDPPEPALQIDLSEVVELDEAELSASAAPQDDSGFDWQALGERTYSNCASCHQAQGQGVPGAFPPLAGHLPDLYNADGGREYIINVVLYGLQGPIEVRGQSYNGVMNAWGGQLSDDEVAAVLNHELTSWGNRAQLEEFTPILPAEVAAQRSTQRSAQQVHELRQQLELP